NIREIESKKSQNLSAAGLEKAFLNAFRQKNPVEANQLISRNRDIIKEKYLPQRLAMSLVEAPNDAKTEYLQALLYAGELEKTHIKDSFAADIGVFYANASETNLELMKKAQASVKNGYKLCLQGEAEKALTEFQLARGLFLDAGNVWEARLSELVIVYCLLKTSRFEESRTRAEEVISFCRERKYKWLLSNILSWFAVAQRKTGLRPQAKLSYRESLALAEEIEDSFLLQSVNLELAKLSKFVGQDKAALQYLQTVFKNSGATGASLRQKWRNYSDGTEILANVKYYNLAEAVSMENILSADDLKDSLLLIYSQQDVGIANARAGNYDAAGDWFVLAKKNAEALADEGDRKELLAKSALELGHLERKRGNYAQAAAFYSEALGYDQKSNYYFYEIQKSRLLASLSLNDEAETEKQIGETLQTVEKYREQILEEHESNSFFNNEQTIYDIAVSNDFKRGNYEQAYNHLETSNSRSLLAWLKKGVEVKAEKEEIEVTFKETTEPLRLNEIRAEMPERVQILQYAVLENKVLIWLISKDDFKTISTDIDTDKLNEKVAAYARRLSDRDNQKQEEAKVLARELYDLLISRVVAHLDPTRRICLIPHKILFHLPFAALTAPDGKPFLAQFNFFYAPSANVFLLCTKNAREKSAVTDESLLSVGNPRFDREEFKDLEYLPDAEEEAKEIALFYTEPKILPGSAATKAALQNSLGDAAIIHFAGHYIVRHGEPLNSGLVLTQTGNGGNPEDSLLTNAELVRRKLPKIKLVVLSACQTGIEQSYNGEGLIGLSRTFLAAGAPLVVASQWQVDSKITAKLMKKFHFFRREQKLSTTEALRRAQLEMMESAEGQYRQPFFWAAFATYGGYAEF
ncbi:MAG TPA: CHAT domain-containing protein, partial [Pyrinomonadaceae bacterium]